MAITPSQRINIIKELVPLLTDEGFGNMELIFDTFHISEGRVKEGRIRDIVRSRLRGATEERLLAIASHYGLTSSGEAAPEPITGKNPRLPMAVCAAASEVLQGSHAALDELFLASGAPGPPPNLAHHTKWKTWLFRASNDPNVDSLALLGVLIEEFMDLPPSTGSTLEDEFGIHNVSVAEYNRKRERLIAVLEQHGFRYFRGGRILPNGEAPSVELVNSDKTMPRKPNNIDQLLATIVKGIPRAMHPLIHRRKGAQCLSFDSEYDIQDLLHSQLRPWIADIRPEECTPSYAGSGARMDFLLPAHSIVLEVKRVRDARHARNIGDELIIDIEHYRTHPDCDSLWCVVYDPMRCLLNPDALKDLDGERRSPGGAVNVRVFIFSG